MKFVVDGKEYNRLEDLPPEMRAKYEQAMGAFDQNRNGIPDFVEGMIGGITNQTNKVQIPLEDQWYREIVGRIRQDDASVPYRDNGYWYYWCYETGREYPVHARKAGTLDAPGQVLIDENELAEGRDFFDVGELEVSPDIRILAYAEDTVGRRQYTLRFKDLASGRMLPDVMTNVEASVAWAADSRTVLYVEKDPQTLLGNRVRRHVLGTDPKDDPVVYEEHDQSFYLGVDTSKKALCMGSAPASYWDMGPSPNMSSIVRSSPEVEYIV